MRIERLVLAIVLTGCTSASDPTPRADAAPQDVGMDARDSPTDAAPAPDFGPFPDLPTSDAAEPDAVVPGPVVFEIGTGEPFSLLNDGSTAPAVLGPQGSYHLEFVARLSGDVRPPDIEFTEIRVQVSDSKGDELGSGYWAIDETLWEEVDGGFTSHLPPTFLQRDPVQGEEALVHAEANAERPLGTVDLTLVFGP